MKAAMVMESCPEACEEMPMSRAPVRLTAMARSALPRSERSKYSHSMTMSATVASAVMMA
ncbi:hypothetical protein D9M69_661010 [compost metagenome]